MPTEVAMITVPPGAAPGQQIAVNLGGQHIMVFVPHNAFPGQQFPVTYEIPESQVVHQVEIENDLVLSESAHLNPKHGFGDAPELNINTPLSTSIRAQRKSEMASNVHFRDPFFALLFVVNVVIIAAFAFSWGVEEVENSNNSSSDSSDFQGDLTDVGGIVGACIGLAIIGGLLSLLSLSIMIKFSRQVVKFTVLGNVLLYFVAGAVFLGLGMAAGLVFWLLAAVSLCYYYCVQRRIPFAAENLKNACEAIDYYKGVVVVAFVGVGFQLTWVLLWSLSFFGINEHVRDTDAASDDGELSQESEDDADAVTGISYFLLLLSFFWGVFVVKNVVHVTTAGVVATWWFTPEQEYDAEHATLPAVKRACTTSFGSICEGSLIVAVLETLKQLAEQSRRRGEDNIIKCCAACILGCLENMAQYFNKWAFIFVGIYGLPFADAGKAVFELFKERGWDLIINDNLVDHVLGFFMISVGAITAALAVAFTQIESSVFEELEEKELVMGFIGFFIGVSMCQIVMGTVQSAVATIFVCFAEDPHAMQNKHPQKFRDLANAWLQVYPEELRAMFQPNSSL